MFISRLFAAETGPLGLGHALEISGPAVESALRSTRGESVGSVLRAPLDSVSAPAFSRGQNPFESLSVEGSPLIDLRTQGPLQVQNLLFQRASAALSIRSRTAHFGGKSISDEVARDLAFMAVMQKTPIQFFLRRSGWPENGVRTVTQRVLERDWTSEYPDFRRNVRESLRCLSRERQETFLAVYLELALHVRIQVAQNLTVAHVLMDLLGLSWTEALALRSSRASSYEREILGLVTEKGGAVSFEDFFRDAMYHPQFGVYSSGSGKSLIGPHGFFSTCSERPAYGKAMARSLCELWMSLNRPTSFDVVEMGGGNGTLAFHCLSEIDRLAASHEIMADFRRALHYRLVETSPSLAARQRAALETFGGRAIVHEGSVLSLEGLPEIENGVFLSNELVDMFPPTHVVNLRGSRFESWVSSEGGFLQEFLKPLSTDIHDFLNRHGIGLEVNSSYWLHRDVDAWMANIRARLKRGYVMTMDYGGNRMELLYSRGGGAFRMMRGYRSRQSLQDLLQINFPDVLAREYDNEPTALFLPKDMTTDVDFTTLSQAAADAGFSERRVLRQGDFLRGVLQASPVGADGVDLASLKNYDDVYVSILRAV